MCELRGTKTIQLNLASHQPDLVSNGTYKYSVETSNGLVVLVSPSQDCRHEERNIPFNASVFPVPCTYRHPVTASRNESRVLKGDSFPKFPLLARLKRLPWAAVWKSFVPSTSDRHGEGANEASF